MPAAIDAAKHAIMYTVGARAGRNGGIPTAAQVASLAGPGPFLMPATNVLGMALDAVLTKSTAGDYETSMRTLCFVLLGGSTLRLPASHFRKAPPY